MTIAELQTISKTAEIGNKLVEAIVALDNIDDALKANITFALGVSQEYNKYKFSNGNTKFIIPEREAQWLKCRFQEVVKEFRKRIEDELQNLCIEGNP